MSAPIPPELWFVEAQAIADTVLETAAVPVDEWPREIDEPVLLLVEHANARYEADPDKRDRFWRAWCAGYWTDFNTGGWVWHGVCGTVTHVRPLPPMPPYRAPPAAE